jgi:hypothetical protein
MSPLAAFRGEGFNDDTGRTLRQSRPNETDTRFWGFSNKAREIEQDIFYKDLPEPIGTRRADFVVEGKVLVELKAVIQLEDVHWAQMLNYLKAYRLEVGLLINFGSKSMTFKRLVL